MRHGVYCLRVLVILAVVALGSCNARKTIQKNSRSFRTDQRIEQSFDKEIKTEKAGTDVRIEAKEDAWEFSRTTDIDTAGNIRRVQETWRGSGRSELALLRDSSRTVSVTDSEIIIQDTDSMILNEEEQTINDSDSRPVQGVEWFWVVIGAGLLLLLIIFLSKRFL